MYLNSNWKHSFVSKKWDNINNRFLWKISYQIYVDRSGKLLLGGGSPEYIWNVLFSIYSIFYKLWYLLYSLDDYFQQQKKPEMCCKFAIRNSLTLFLTGPCTCTMHMPYIHGLNISYHESNMCCWSEILWSLSENLMNLILTYFCIKIDIWQNDNILTTNFASFEPVLQKQFFSNSEGEVEAKTGFSSNRCFCTSNMSLVNGFRACAHS
jgi:hypothetical protein